ncbi:uncharacterized protein [Typha latifolia]|uniref:uncharacterized protein n=1 Tax=Typha latifolia TaxID=4733 RepID=UPI003C2E3E49
MASLHLARSSLSPAICLRFAGQPPRRFSTAVLRLRCRLQDKSGGEKDGEEAPESLFMKELRRRGMTPSSLVEEKEMEVNEETKKSGVASAEYDKAMSNQRERSMALNSEGLEGLIPRAKLLLSIGATFFLGFWPLMVITISLFSALYFYFGPSFVHDASNTQISPPPYIDPYKLLEDERLSQVTPNVK